MIPFGRQHFDNYGFLYILWDGCSNLECDRVHMYKMLFASKSFVAVTAKSGCFGIKSNARHRNLKNDIDLGEGRESQAGECLLADNHAPTPPHPTPPM